MEGEGREGGGVYQEAFWDFSSLRNANSIFLHHQTEALFSSIPSSVVPAAEFPNGNTDQMLASCIPHCQFNSNKLYWHAEGLLTLPKHITITNI